MFRKTVLIFAVALTLPLSAAADYLYGLNKDSGIEPYVFFLADVSLSMETEDAGCPAGCTLRTDGRCLCGSTNRNQYTRMEALQATLKELIPQLDNVFLGMAKFGVRAGSNYCRIVRTNPLPTKAGQQPPNSDALIAEVNKFKPDGGTPIGAALENALSHLQDVRKADTHSHCRPYAVVILTDGQPDCPSDYGGSEPKGNPSKAYAAVDALRNAKIPTYVVGFGAQANRKILDQMARLGGTARTSQGWCKRNADGSCSAGEALYANDALQLREVLQTTFEEIRRGQYTVAPAMVGTVPQEKSEYDRVANNFMVYTAFDVPDYKGRIYGVRLFKEVEGEPGHWEFTDLTSDNPNFSLTKCGQKGNPCVFEAGAMLQDRTSPRKIFFAVPEEVETADNQLVLTMGDRMTPTDSTSWQSTLRTVALTLVGDSSPLKPGVDALDEAQRSYLNSMAQSLTSEPARQRRQQVAQWIDGTSRPWRLGDMYHSAVAIVTSPPYTYRGYGYPVFKANYRNRPAMIYVGANDGQIHAFYASDDHFPEKEGQPRWKAGEEAWAYVPFNMFAKVALAAIEGQSRVWSQDLSCRVDDVVAYPTVAGEGEIDCSLDPEHEERGTCGWRTVLICGQGWGGSWYVALDVTDPHDPRPMWEATHLGNGTYGLGRTWAVPSVGPVNLEVEKDGKKIGVPTWLAVYGSGYNTGLKDHFGNTSAAYRYLNMPFAGPYPEHGAGIKGEKGGSGTTSFIFIQDVISGRYLKVFPVPKQYGITADIPLIGTSDPFYVNVGYFGGWEGGKMGRLYLPEDPNTRMTRPDLWGICPEILAFSESKPLTSRPSVFNDPHALNQIYLFVGSGLDPGTDPDQQANQGKMWEFQAFHFEDPGDSTCPKINNPNICTQGEVLKNIFNDGARLIAPPTLHVKRNFEKWLLFTSWKPQQGKGCGDGTAYLYCIDVSRGEICTPCGGDDGDEEGSFVRREVGGQKSQTPVIADEQIYVIGDEGTPLRFNASQPGSGGGTPNQNAPKAMILSWREIF